MTNFTKKSPHTGNGDGQIIPETRDFFKPLPVSAIIKDMDPESVKQINHPHICELCLKHDPLVKDYSEDQELQTAIRTYIAGETGDNVSVTEIGKMCDSCYFLVNEVTNNRAKETAA